MPRSVAELAQKLSPPRHMLWASIETVIKSQCKGMRKGPAYRQSSTRTYRLPATGDELTIQVYPRNCMISHGDTTFTEIPREHILLYLKAFIAEKNLTN